MSLSLITLDTNIFFILNSFILFTSIFNFTAIDLTLLDVWSSSLLSFSLNLANLNLNVADCVMSPKDVQSTSDVVDVAICTLWKACSCSVPSKGALALSKNKAPLPESNKSYGFWASRVILGTTSPSYIWDNDIEFVKL